jgi:hypothetical protein
MGSEANVQGLKRYPNFMQVALWVCIAMLDCQAATWGQSYQVPIKHPNIFKLLIYMDIF